ncbi:MAG: YceI family protein [Ktedonobacterales bacterium]|nr:YceI family protein [Ktedonobacterales bacterium]
MQQFLSQRRNVAISAVATVVVLAAIAWVVLGNRHGANASHQAVGVAVACGTPIPTSTLQHFTVAAAQSSATYSVKENLILGGVGDRTTVGTTPGVAGDFFIRTTPSPLVAQVRLTIDLTKLTTDSSQRDRFVRQNYLQTDQFPTAEFNSTCVNGLPATVSDGQDLSFQLVGNLSLHGKVNQETFTVKGKVAGSTITGTATTDIFMTDFGIQPPDIANFAIADNKVTLTLTFTAQQG